MTVGCLSATSLTSCCDSKGNVEYLHIFNRFQRSLDSNVQFVLDSLCTQNGRNCLLRGKDSTTVVNSNYLFPKDYCLIALDRCPDVMSSGDTTLLFCKMNENGTLNGYYGALGFKNVHGEWLFDFDFFGK